MLSSLHGSPDWEHQRPRVAVRTIVDQSVQEAALDSNGILERWRRSPKAAIMFHVRVHG